MLHAERPDGPVAAAQKCAIHGPVAGQERLGDVDQQPRASG